MASNAVQTAADRADHRWRKDRPQPAQPRGDVDLLVATYAPQGRARRNAQRIRNAKIAGAGLLALAALGLGAVFLAEQASDNETGGTSLSASISAELEGARRISSELASELELVSRQRRELEIERRRVVEQRQALHEELGVLHDQQTELESRRQGLDLQRDSLAAQLVSLDTEQSKLEEQRSLLAADGPQLDRALADLTRKREALEREQSLFREQRSRFVAEIELLTGQREQLESQRQQLESQWAELQSLMEQASGENAGAPAPGLEPTDADSGPAAPVDPYSRADETAWPLSGGLAALADEDLGEMRGAISFGDDLSIAIGLTRTASVNGVEQYSSSLRFDNLNALSMSDLGAANTLLIQSGPGNSVAPAVVNALSNGVATIIQNTLDNQNIATTNVFDVAIGNTATAISGAAAIDAITDSVAMQP